MSARDKLRERIRSDQTLQKSISDQISFENHAGEGDLKTLKVERISLNPKNPRKLVVSITEIKGIILQTKNSFLDTETKIDFNQSSYTEKLLENIKKITDETKAGRIEKIFFLAKSINDQTLIQPISVISNPEGNYIIQAGERRYLAHILLERETIRALVRQKSSDSLKEHSISLIENIVRDDLSTSEKIDYIEELIKIYQTQKNIDITAQKLSEMIHESERTCRRYIRFINSSDNIRNEIKKGELLTVRQIEDAIQKEKESQKHDKKNNKSDNKAKNENENERVEGGRKRIKVSLGRTNDTSIVKKITEALLKSNYLELKQNVNWDNLDEVQKHWDDLLKKLSTKK